MIRANSETAVPHDRVSGEQLRDRVYYQEHGKENGGNSTNTEAEPEPEEIYTPIPEDLIKQHKKSKQVKNVKVTQ